MAEEKLLLSAPKAEQQKEAVKTTSETAKSAENEKPAIKVPERIEKVFAGIETADTTCRTYPGDQ